MEWKRALPHRCLLTVRSIHAVLLTACSSFIGEDRNTSHFERLGKRSQFRPSRNLQYNSKIDRSHPIIWVYNWVCFRLYLTTDWFKMATVGLFSLIHIQVEYNLVSLDSLEFIFTQWGGLSAVESSIPSRSGSNHLCDPLVRLTHQRRLNHRESYFGFTD